MFIRNNIHSLWGGTALLLWLVLPLALSAKPKIRSIKGVETVRIETCAGHAPRLPWQVWVTYSDGTQEWRQVRWSNSDVAEERRQANAQATPAGTKYAVRGFILGDNNTPQGYPIDAQIVVVEDATPVPSSVKAEPLPLSQVRLTGKNRLTSNRDLDVRMLLSLDITQQLYNYRDTYGLPTEGYTQSSGWDAPTTKLKGHGTGHYLSALAHAYAGAREEDKVTLYNGQTVNVKKELHQRITRMVREMRECQERTFVWSDSLGRYFEARDYAPEPVLKEMKGTWAAFDEHKKDYRHYGYGYMNAIPAAHPALIECYRAYNNEEWVWAPYYTIHKQLAGLIDIALVIKESDKETADMALRIAMDMGMWVWNRMHYRTFCQQEGNTAARRSRPGNRYEMWNMYIAGEVGGMSESLARLAEMSQDQEQKARLIEAANCFDAPAFFDPVAHNVDDLRTRHAN